MSDNDKTYLARENTMQDILSKISLLGTKDKMNSVSQAIQSGSVSVELDHNYSSYKKGLTTSTISATGSGIAYILPEYATKITIDGIVSQIQPSAGHCCSFEFTKSFKAVPVSSGDYFTYVICID